MCRTFEAGRHRYDAGAHRFHDRDADITQDVYALMDGGLAKVAAPSKVWIDGKLIDFPPTPLNALFAFGLRDAAQIAFEILRARWHQPDCVNFGDFARCQFGETLAQRLLIDYSEKLWGLPADQLSPNIATRRLQGMTLRSLALELFLSRRKTKHIDGEFLYPTQGYGEIVERLVGSLPKNSLATEREVARLEAKAGVITHIHFKNGATEKVCGRVVSTVPLTLLAKLLTEHMPARSLQAADRLRFRHLRLVFLQLKIRAVSDNASIYLPSPKFKTSRVYEPKIRSALMAPNDETSLVAEVPCFAQDQVSAMSDNAVAALVIDELVSTGLIKRADVMQWRHHWLPNAYPVYSLGYEQEVATIAADLKQFTNLDTIGRAGSFFYSHLHDQLRLAKDYVAALGPAGELFGGPDSANDDMKVANLNFASR
jgi:protoporphyrinogen oxidase